MPPLSCRPLQMAFSLITLSLTCVRQGRALSCHDSACPGQLKGRGRGRPCAAAAAGGGGGVRGARPCRWCKGRREGGAEGLPIDQVAFSAGVAYRVSCQAKVTTRLQRNASPYPPRGRAMDPVHLTVAFLRHPPRYERMRKQASTPGPPHTLPTHISPLSPTPPVPCLFLL